MHLKPAKLFAFDTICAQASIPTSSFFYPHRIQRSLNDRLPIYYYQAEVAEWVGADVINIHAGGAYGKKDEALKRLVRQIRSLPQNVCNRLTLENDDRLYTPRDLLPVCEKLGIPLVYDLHHHRCLPDGRNVANTTREALRTWNREPLFHISSPLKGWQDENPRNHHDYINPDDFPDCWLNLDITVEVEAKAKELAVLKLMRQIAKKEQMRAS